jgi:sodium transport system ATP-binding protein
MSEQRLPIRVKTHKLCRNFGKIKALRSLDLSIPAGEVYGLIGPNGAGKTTALRIMAGLMPATTGEAFICGHEINDNPTKVKASLGFQTGSTTLYGRLRVSEVLDYFGQLYGLKRKTIRERIAILAEQFQFSDLLHRRCDKLSTGQKQRVSLARAVIHDPMLVILDEPTAGLDVLASRFVADFITDAKTRGRTIIFSTHYMTEAELLCDRLGLLYGGRLKMEGSPAEIKEALAVNSLEEAFIRFADEAGR